MILATHDDQVMEKIKLLVYPEVKAKESALKKYNIEIIKAVKEIRSGKYFTEEEADSLLAEWGKKLAAR